MKKFLHSLTRWFLSLLLVAACISEMVVPTLADDNISGNIYVLSNPIPSDAKDYALSIAESHITTFLKMNNSYRNECTEDVDTYLGDGYYVYRDNEGILFQGDIIDFPVIQNGQVVLIIHVTYTEDGWRSTASYAYSDELNQYIHTGIICRIIAYDEYSDCNVVPVNIAPTDGVATRAVDQYMVDTIPSDLYVRSDCKLGRMYAEDPANQIRSGGFSQDDPTYKLLNMANCFLLQVDEYGVQRGLCWAATAGTMIRYLTDTYIINAYQIANELGIGYDDGGTVYDILNALNNHGCGTQYQALLRMAWPLTEVYHNINNQYPIAIVGTRYDPVTGETYGHAVTVIGYNVASLIYWNSASGQMTTAAYSATATYFTTGTRQYKWVNSVLIPLP